MTSLYTGLERGRAYILSVVRIVVALIEIVEAGLGSAGKRGKAAEATEDALLFLRARPSNSTDTRHCQI